MSISDWSSDVCSSDLRRAKRWAPYRAFRLAVDAGANQRLASRLPPNCRNAQRRPANLGPTPFHRLPRPTHRREETDLAGRQFAGGLQLLGGDQAPTAPARPRVRCALYQTCTRERSEEHTSELQSLMRISYAVFCLKKKKINIHQPNN